MAELETGCITWLCAVPSLLPFLLCSKSKWTWIYTTTLLKREVMHNAFDGAWSAIAQLIPERAADDGCRFFLDSWS